MYIRLAEFLEQENFFEKLVQCSADRVKLISTIEEEFLAGFLTSVISESEEILAIDPRQPRQKILEEAAERIVKDLNAVAATIRFFDPQSLKMLSFGAYGMEGYESQEAIPAGDSIAGLVVRENKSILVPDILLEPTYKNKQIVAAKGYQSLMAVPLRLPSFISRSRDLLGSLQIYYREKGRHFSKQEVLRAEMLARRINFVLARKKILDLKALNDYKERISDQIFLKISNRQGIKLKDFFILMMPELERFFQMQSCSLFTLSEDKLKLKLEAAYPLDETYHESGHSFTVAHHPYFKVAVHGATAYGDHPYERIDEGYVLIKDPLRSGLISTGIRNFVSQHQIQAILLVPLRVGGLVRHIITFYAADQKQYFPEEEIELFTFFGKEIMKASRLEFLGDMLHDFKNPAVAVAGLAARAGKLLSREDFCDHRDKLAAYLDIIARETTRMQDLALTMTGEGKEQRVNLVKIAHERFLLNEEVIRENKRRNITTSGPSLQASPLEVICSAFGLERVLDNLLNNATKAIPKEGGALRLDCFQEDGMACLKLSNTGAIPSEKLEEVRRGEVKGRGLNIVQRFIQAHHGQIEVNVEGNTTIFIVRLPLAD